MNALSLSWPGPFEMLLLGIIVLIPLAIIVLLVWLIVSVTRRSGRGFDVKPAPGDSTEERKDIPGA